MKNIFYPLCLFLLLTPHVNASSLWHDVPVSANNRAVAKAMNVDTSNYRPIATENSQIKSLLWQAPIEGNANSNVIIDLPLPDGSFVNLQVFESPILATNVAKQFPQLKTFKVVGVDDASITGRIDLTPKGFHAMLHTPDGIVFINPEANYDSTVSDTLYRSFNKNRQSRTTPFECKTNEHQKKYANISTFNRAASQTTAAKNFGAKLRTYRLALSATKQYSTAVAQGNLTNTLAEMVTAINRVNEVYATDVGVKLELVSGKELISTTTSDFTDDDGGVMLDENQAWIDAKLGNAAYDIGHVFSTGGGGLASLAVVCATDHSKAQGVTGSPSPTTDAFYIDYVAHEIGHQFGATHTFNADGANTGFCDGNRETDITADGSFLAESAYEVGSGSTIMAYAGICNVENLQTQGDPYFHARSIEQIRQFIDGDIATTYPNINGSICGITSSTGDAIPVADAGKDFTIPANTPFVLTGSATDSDSAASTITYTWEEYDLGRATTSLSDMHTDHGKGPLVRSVLGTSDPKRFIPNLSSVLISKFTETKGIRLPTTDRTMNFMLTVRSGTNGVAQDRMKITVDKDAGPFLITLPAKKITAVGGESIKVTWNVANTTAAPVSCAFVDINYSTNGGTNFTSTLLKATANDGLANVILPKIATSNGRIKIQCSNNIFYAISPNDTTKPKLTQVTAVSTPTLDTTPKYTFNTSEAGSIFYTGDCSSNKTTAILGNNTVTFKTLSVGIHNNCTIKVKDLAGNISLALTIPSFTIKT